jgi:hypothetical protein
MLFAGSPDRVTMPSHLAWQTVRWCLVVMKFDESLNTTLSKWIATWRKRLVIIVAMSSLAVLCTGLFSYVVHPCLQV